MKSIDVSIAGDGTLTVSPREKHVLAGDEVVWQSPQGVQVSFAEPGRWSRGGPDRATVKPDTPPGMLGCTIKMDGHPPLEAGVIVDPKSKG